MITQEKIANSVINAFVILFMVFTLLSIFKLISPYVNLGLVISGFVILMFILIGLVNPKRIFNDIRRVFNY